MLREILFKAKRSDNGEWVEGYPFPSVAGKELNRMTVFEPFPGGTVVNTYDVDKKTVCQYTGLVDKNGVKIFGGDKLANKYGETGIVEYGVENCGCCHDVYGFAVDGLEKWIDKDLLVIGNIHDKED